VSDFALRGASVTGFCCFVTRGGARIPYRSGFCHLFLDSFETEVGLVLGQSSMIVVCVVVCRARVPNGSLVFDNGNSCQLLRFQYVASTSVRSYEARTIAC
jgi:hypothetical protein